MTDKRQLLDPAEADADGEPRVYAARWTILAIYAFLAFLNQALWMTFSPIQTGTAHRFDVPDVAIVSLNVTAAALFIPGAFVCARILEKQGLRGVVVCGASAQAVGAVIRLVGDAAVRRAAPRAGFAVLYIGQAVVSLTSPVFLNLPSVLAEAWFGVRQREVALAVGTLSQLLGQGVGGALAGVIAGGDHADGMSPLLAGQAVVCALATAVAMCTFRSAPPTPPSRAAAAAASRSTGESVWAVSLRLLRQPRFVLLLFAFNMGIAVAAAIIGLSGILFGRCGYSSAVAGMASLVFMVGGVFGSLGASYVLGKTGAYTRMLRLVITASAAAGLLLFAVLQPGNTGLVIVAMGHLGFWMVAALPVLIANAVEETYPTPSDAPVTLMFTSSNIAQIAFTFGADALLEAQHGCGTAVAPARVFLFGLAFFGCLVPVWFYEGRQNRRLAEADARETATAGEHQAVVPGDLTPAGEHIAYPGDA